MDRIKLSKRVSLKYIDSPWEYMDYYGLCKGYEIYREKNARSHSFTLVDPTNVKGNNKYKVVAETALDRSYANSWQCVYTRVDSDYQGNDIALNLYKFILRHGYVLEAGHGQSDGGRYLWWKLSKQSNVIMIAKQKYSRQEWIMPVRDNIKRELRSDFFDLYDNDKQVNVYAFYNQK